MTIRIIYQAILLALVACCIGVIMVITIPAIQNMIDTLSSYAGRVRFPMY
jgi:hypothetical protein